jgi:hypothetical protein
MWRSWDGYTYWVLTTPGRYARTVPVISASRKNLYVVSEEGIVSCIRILDGTLGWSALLGPIKKGITPAFDATRAMLYLPSTDGYVYAIAAGEHTPQAPTQTPTASPTTKSPNASPTTKSPTASPTSSPTTTTPSAAPTMTPTKAPTSAHSSSDTSIVTVIVIVLLGGLSVICAAAVYFGWIDVGGIINGSKLDGLGKLDTPMDSEPGSNYQAL